jgi:hypothetical protein
LVGCLFSRRMKAEAQILEQGIELAQGRSRRSCR